MLLGLAVNLAPPTGPARWLLHGALLVSTLGVLGLLGRPLVVSALEEARRRRPSIELLFLAGILGALGASLLSTVTGTGAVYYEVVGVLTSVYAIGKTLGARSRARALAETRQLRAAFDTCSRIEPDGATRAVPVVEVREGDRVRVLAGQPIPIDGRIEQGEAFICETPLTGEPFPVVRRPGDLVLAGSYAEDGQLTIAATAPGNRRRLDELLAALECARERPCRLQAQADRIVHWFLPVVLTVSVGTFLFWTWRSSWDVGLYNALAVLLVACPCAMGLATPVALWSGLAALAARGLVLRGGDEIERLARTEAMVFDKTGTLSEERYGWVDLATAGGPEDRRALMTLLQAVQQASTHPVARAFHAPGGSDAPMGYRVRRLKTAPALGVEAWVESDRGDEHHLKVGRAELVADRSSEEVLLGRLRRGPSDRLVYVEVDGRLSCIAAVNERLRASARDTLGALAVQGIRCEIMTGDASEHAGQLLGDCPIRGSMTPPAKAEAITRMREANQAVCFVGDGANDAPAMRAASLGVALAHGAGVTTAQADAVLYGGDLATLPWAVALCRQVRDSIRSNLLFAAAYNLVGIVLAATGVLHPVVAALLMVVSSFTVSWRALRSTECGAACGLVAGGPTPAASADARAAAETPSATDPAGSGKPVPLARRAVRPARSPAPWGQRLQKWAGVCLLAQLPFLIYLGQMRGGLAWAFGLGWLALAFLSYKFRAKNHELAHAAFMTITMLGFGNWGMIVGWWADAGFMPPRSCCMGDGSEGFSFLAFTGMPWMNFGMLLLGLPPMLMGPSRSYRGLGRAAYGVLSSLGMVWGMSYGSYVFLNWLSPYTSQRFLLSFGGMTVGMMLGMFLCCEFGRALSLAIRGWGSRR